MTKLQYTTMCNRIIAQGLSLEDLTNIINDKLAPDVPRVCAQEEINYLLQQELIPEEVEEVLIEAFGLRNLNEKWGGVPPTQMSLGIEDEINR